jgi:hypothetical protein
LIIEGLSSSTNVSNQIKTQVTGEAKFVRALCNFYLVNLFGDVPLVVVSNFQNNSALPRTSKTDVYQQIISDLKDAQNLLAETYSFSNNERVRPTKWAATALLSRVYLYQGDYADAESEATKIIDNTGLFSLVNINSVFLKNSKEAIWQLMPVLVNLNTNEGNIFILTSSPSSISMSTQLLNSFETGDLRRSYWVGTLTVGSNTFYFPYKYKVKSGSGLSEYSMVLRLAELYLIRAEARAQQSKIAESQSDLNAIRNRAGLTNTTANDKSSLLVAIQHERQVELFTEGGHRWFDLKRTNNIDMVMSNISTLKGGSWSNFKALYPIPQTEIINDVNLSQNTGY